MFESIRSHKRWLMLFMLVLIFPSFVFFGIQGYNSFMGSEGALATVDGVPVTQRDFDAVHRERLQRLQQQMEQAGQPFDPSVLDSREARAGLLEGMLFERALKKEVEDGNLVISNERLRDVIAGIPAFQEDGRFSIERYRQFLASRGESERQFEEQMRDDLRVRMLYGAVLQSSIVPGSVVDRLEALLREQREVRILPLRADAFLPKVTVTDAQIAEYYDGHKDDFATPENVKVEYLVMDAEALAGKFEVTDAQIKEYYDANQARFGAPEERRASHILIATEGKDKAEARKQADAILAQVRAKPDDFARLAKEQSKDPGSAAQGGDLGFFGKGMMVKPFEEAVFSMKVGDISEVVESDFGFHVIRLTEIRPAQVKPLAAVRAEIITDLRTQQAQKRFAEAADQFTNLVYEQAESLQPAADKLGLKVATQDNLTRAGLPAPQAGDKQPQIFTRRVMDAIFAEDSLKNHRNTQAIEVAPNVMVAARVVEHRPAAIRPLDAVKSAIRDRLERQEAGVLARKAGEEKLAALVKQPNDNGFSPLITVSRRAPQGMPPQLLSAVLATQADKLPTFVGADIDGQGYLIAQVVSARPSETPEPAQRAAALQALQRQASAADELGYIEGLQARHKVKITHPDFRREAVKPDAATPTPAPKAAPAAAGK